MVENLVKGFAGALAAFALITSVPVQAQSTGTLYLVEDSSANALYRINTTTAAATLVGAGNSAGSEGLALSNNPSTLLYGTDGDEITEIATDGSVATTTAIDPVGDRGLTFMPGTGFLYGGDNGNFDQIDPVTGIITPLAALPGGEDVEGLAADVANNVIYGVGNDEVLYVYDVALDTWATVGPTTVGTGNDIGLAFDPAANTLYAVDSDGILYRIAPATGATVVIGNTGIGASLDVGLAFAPLNTAVPTLPIMGIFLLVILLIALAGYFTPRAVRH